MHMYDTSFMSLCSVVLYVRTPVGVLPDLQAPPPNTYRGLYCDPEKAGELYAEEIKKLIDEAHSKGNKVCICNMCMCGCVNLIYHDHICNYYARIPTYRLSKSILCFIFGRSENELLNSVE